MNFMYDVSNDVTHHVDHNVRDVICEIQFSILILNVFFICVVGVS
jgi:hypothetical protein